jgi:outer membrane receptor protein involved in Fe transport
MVQQVEGGPSTINRESGGGHSSRNNVSVTGKLGYELDTRTSITGELFAGAGTNPSRNRAHFIGLTPDFDSFSERSHSDFKDSWAAFRLSLDRKGKKDGETLKASAGAYGNPSVRQPIISQFGEGDSYSSLRRRNDVGAFNSVDWVHPIGKDKILSLGSNINVVRNHFGYAFSSSDAARFGPDFDDSFNARETSVSAYVTFQKRLGSWTIMPGARLEEFRRKISSPGRPSSRTNWSNLSPTLHIEHPLGKTVNMTLSYSKRFENPGYEEISPYPIVTGPLAIQQGNPDLREQETAAYELSLHYSRKLLEVGLTIYDRETDRLWSNIYSVNDQGLNIFTPTNIGNRTDRGAELDISTPLFKRVKGNASFNLFSSRVPIVTEDGPRSSDMFRYTANATVEWHEREKGKTPGDIAQVQLTYASASREFQFHRRDYLSLNFAYTHSLSPSLSITATLDGIGSTHTGHRLFAPLIQETYDRRERPEFKLKLVKTLGSENP